MDFASLTRAAETGQDGNRVVICAALTTLQGYGIDKTRLDGYNQINEISFMHRKNTKNES